MATSGRIILGRQQTDWQTQEAFANFKQTVYGFQSQTLQNQAEKQDAPYVSSIGSQQKALLEQENPAGGIVFHHHIDKMGIFYEEFLQGSWVSNDFTPQEVFAQAAYTSGVGFSLDTQPTATSPVSAPGQLVFTLDSAGGFSDGSIAITGESNGCPLTETITFGAQGAGPQTFTSTKYFDTVNASAVVITHSGATADDVQIDADRNIYTASMTIADSIGNGLSMEMAQRDIDNNLIANVFIGMLLNELNIAFGRPGITLTTSWLGYKGLLRQNLGDTGEAPTDLSGWTNPRLTEDRFPFRAVSFLIDGVKYNQTPDLTVGMSRNLGYPDRGTDSIYRAKPITTGLRPLTVSGAIDYRKVANGGKDLELKAKTDEDTDIQIIASYQKFGGVLSSLTMNFNTCQIMNYPAVSVDAGYDSRQPFVFNPRSTDGVLTPDEVDIVIESLEDPSA